MLPCSAYIKARKPKLYKVLLEKSKRYKECIRRGFARYNVSGIPARNLNKLIREDKRLTTERELTFLQVTEALARAERLKKQSLSVQEKINKLSTRVSTKLNEEDSINSIITSGPPIVRSSTTNFPFPGNSFWNFFSENVAKEPLRSIGSPLVPIYYLILSTPSTLFYTLAYYLPIQLIL